MRFTFKFFDIHGAEHTAEEDLPGCSKEECAELIDFLYGEGSAILSFEEETND